MATAGSLINDALRDLGVLGQGQVASGNDAADALNTLNQLIAYWNTRRLFIFAVTETAHTLTGAASYTIGTGGDINTTRPQKISAAAVRDNGVDVPIEVTDDAGRWSRVAVKALTGGTPVLLYYEQTYPLGRIYLYPLGGSESLRLWLWSQLSSFTTVGTAVSLPPGYEPALRFTLATWLAPSYGKEVPSRIDQLARQAMRGIQQLNADAPMMMVDHPAVLRGYNIITDSP
jgi:hypothetical protein